MSKLSIRLHPKDLYSYENKKYIVNKREHTYGVTGHGCESCAFYGRFVNMCLNTPVKCEDWARHDGKNILMKLVK